MISNPVVVSLSLDRRDRIEGRVSHCTWSRAFRLQKQAVGCRLSPNDGTRPLTTDQCETIYKWVQVNKPSMLLGVDHYDPKYQFPTKPLPYTAWPCMWVEVPAESKPGRRVRPHIYPFEGATMSTRKWKSVQTEYRGRRVDGMSLVGVYNPKRDGKTLQRSTLQPGPSQALCNHSPDGFNWGYGGSGPAQLALAILLDFTNDKDLALQHYQNFKWAFVARWGDATWKLTGHQLVGWLPKQPTHVEAQDMARRAMQRNEP